MIGIPRSGRPDLVSDALRQLWANAESDPVPTDFLALLDQLDAARTSDPAADPAADGRAAAVDSPSGGDRPAA